MAAGAAGGKLDPAQARKALNWDEGRLESAAAALRDMGLSDGRTEAGPAPPPAPEGPPEYTAADITRELEQAGSPFPGLVGEVQRRLGKVLSTADLKKPVHRLRLPGPAAGGHLPAGELVRGGIPAQVRPRPDAPDGGGPAGGLSVEAPGVDTAQAADAYLKRQELYRTREGEILKLLDLPLRPLVDKERKKVQAWTDMGFDDQALRLAYEKTVYKKQKMDWDYMNGILCGWHKKNLHTLAEIEAGDAPRRRSAGPAMQDHPARPGDADRRVREDVARMREFLRRQNEEGG